MGKKFISETSEQNEDLSDLEGEFTTDNHSNNVIVEDKEALENHSLRIKNDFNKIMKNQNVPWIETMDLIADEAVDPSLNMDDDIKRELIFYNLTIQNAVRGIVKLKEHGEKLNRPGDFFAEMVKSDNQMEKIKKQIITEQQRIKKFEEKKNKLQNIKFAKAMKDNQQKQKSEYKKKSNEAIESWKKRNNLIILDIKKKPGDYAKLDDFLDNGGRVGKGRFNQKFSKGGDFPNKRNHNHNDYKKKGKQTRPGKIKRMIQRNKKNSKRR